MKRFITFILTAMITISCATGSQIVMATPTQLTAQQVHEVKSKVAALLRDPSSTEFRNIRAANAVLEDNRNVIAVCGEVNGKNAFGGYVGFTPFLGSFENGIFTVKELASGEGRDLYAATIISSCAKV